VYGALPAIIANFDTGRNRRERVSKFFKKWLGEGGGMKLNRAEWAAVAITAVLLALMAGWALGAGRARQTLRLSDPGTAAALASSAPSPSGDLPASPDPSTSPGAAETAGFPLDLNTATAEELLALPGIGEKRAADIVAWREAHGPFRYVEDLIQVPGIGEGVLEGLVDYITVGGT